MILRIRTNVGVTRLEADASKTIAQLKELIQQILNIVQTDGASFVLAGDLAGYIAYDQNESTLSDLGIVHGSELFVMGKFEKRTVEKSYVGENGVVVPAGQTLVRIEEIASNESSSAASNVDTIKEDKQITGKPVAETSTESVRMNAAQSSVPPETKNDGDFHFNYDDYNDLLDFQEEEDEQLRAPDEIQRMNLLGEPSVMSYDLNNTEAGRTLMHAVLLPEEQEQIDRLERSLREAGMREYDVHLETQQLQDELIATRLQRESAGPTDTLSAALLASDLAIQESMSTIDATLARYKQKQQRGQAQPDILRLQAYQQTAKTASRATASAPVFAAPKKSVTSKPTVPLSSSVPIPAAEVVGVTKPSSTGTPKADSSAATDNKPAQVVPDAPIVDAKVPATKPLKGRQPSKALTDAMRNLDTVTRDLPASLQTSSMPINVRGSALQRGGLRSLTAPANTVEVNASGSAVTPPPLAVHDVDNDKMVQNTMQSVPDTTVSRTSVMTMHEENTSMRPVAPFTPFTPYAATNRAADDDEYYNTGQVDHDNEEALLMLLNSPKPPATRVPVPAHSVSAKVNPIRGADYSRNLNQAGVSGAAQTPVQKVTPSRTLPTTPAASLIGSGYKSMTQIQAEKRQQGANMRSSRRPAPASAPINPTQRAALSSTPTSSQRNPSSAANSAAVTRESAPYQMKAERGLLTEPTAHDRGMNQDKQSIRRTGGVATTVVAPISRISRASAQSQVDQDLMDETLALALQLSLEDSKQGGGTQGARQSDYSEYNSLFSGYIPTQDVPSAQSTAKTTQQAPAPVKRNLFTKHAPTAPAGRSAEQRQAQLRAEAAQAREDALRREEQDRRAAEDLQEQLNRENESMLLRQQLYYPDSNSLLPQWLERKVHDGANEAMYDLAAQESFQYQQYAMPVRPAPAPVPAPVAPRELRAPLNRPYQGAQFQNNHHTSYEVGDANYMRVEYDEEDELFARALQESLNEQLY